MGDNDPGALQPHALPAGALELTKQLEMEKIDSLQSRVLVLCKEKDFLKKRLDKAEKDTHEFVNYFQDQIEQKDATIKQLQENLQRTEISAKQSIREAKDNAVEQIRKIKEESDGKILDLTNHLESSQEEVHKLNHFMEIKEKMEGQIKDLEVQIYQLKKKANDDLNIQERKFLTEKSHMQKGFDAMTEGIKQAARVEAQAGLDSETKKIVSDNRRMGEELRFQLQMMSELQAEKAKSDEMVKQLRRDCSILAEKEKEYAKQGQQRANENKILSNKVMSLEEALLVSTKKFKEDREKIKGTVAKELEDVTMDANGLKHLILLKNKELSHIKKLAQTILDQRGEVEQFFLESIEEVKEKIVNERESKYRKSLIEYNKKMREATSEAQGGEGKFPSIRGRNLSFMEPEQASALPINPSKKVDLTELTWEDRERVLRLLFAKINNVQGNVEALPQHPLEGAGMPQPPSAAGGSRGRAY